MPLGPTSVPIVGSDVGADYDAGYASPVFSHAAINLGAGTYTISGIVTLSPFESGGAAAELVSLSAPEPATWGLMILGFGVVGGAMRSSRVRRTTVKFA